METYWLHFGCLEVVGRGLRLGGWILELSGWIWEAWGSPGRHNEGCPMVLATVCGPVGGPPFLCRGYGTTPGPPVATSPWRHFPSQV